ncbi:MAG: hypothetical protein ACRBF0_05255 [Calditrichia bacterium]
MIKAFTQFVIYATILLLNFSSCAPPIRTLMPATKKNYAAQKKLIITMHDGSKHKLIFKKSDETGIYGFGQKYFSFEEIAFIETERANPANVGIAILGTAAVGATVIAIAAIKAQQAYYKGIAEGLSGLSSR